MPVTVGDEAAGDPAMGIISTTGGGVKELRNGRMIMTIGAQVRCARLAA
jgi:hypothetical protein